jgi:glycosyltransferase involved in cell wall biosynthesis
MKNDLGRSSLANRPLLSIIITSYTTERLKDIFDLLKSIQSQTYENIEVVFVAERSRELMEKVKEHADKIGLANIRVVFNDGKQGLSAARNLGIKMAVGEIIAFVDDDAVLCPQWAEEIVKTYLKDTSVIGVTGSIYPLWVNGSVKWFPEEFDWILSCTRWFPYEKLTEVRNVWGGNFSFRKEAFELCGYFNTNFGFPKGTYEGSLGEDNEFSMRVRSITKKRIVYNPSIKVYHKVHSYRLRWSFIARRAFNMGRSRRMLKMYYSGKGSGENVLSTEFLLLRRIFSKLFTSSDFYLGAGKFLTVLLILSFVMFGYLFPLRFSRKAAPNRR